MHYLVQDNNKTLFELGIGLHNPVLLIQRTKESLYNHIQTEIASELFSVFNMKEWAMSIAESIWSNFQLAECKIVSKKELDRNLYADYILKDTIYNDKTNVGKTVKLLCKE